MGFSIILLGLSLILVYPMSIGVLPLGSSVPLLIPVNIVMVKAFRYMKPLDLRTEEKPNKVRV